MPSYAILGATGQTGRALVTVLLQSPKNNINVYVRSKAKWESLRPDVSGVEQVQVFHGDIHDVPLIAHCVSGVSAIFSVVASNENTPYLRVAQGTAQVVVAALCHLRALDPAAKLPKIVVLSSSAINPHLCRHQPAWLHWLLRNAFNNVYGDLALAEDYLRLHRSWLNVTFIQPGGLVHDAQKGHAISLEREKTFLSYLDLAAGMVEVADVGPTYDWMGVSIVPTANDVKVHWKVLLEIVEGLLWHFMPWLMWLIRYFWYAC